MHVHARAGAAHFTLHVAHVTHAGCVAILAKAASAFLREPPAQNGYGGAWLALSCAQWITGARTGGEPLGAHWDHRAEARDTAGGPGRYTNNGHGIRSSRAPRSRSWWLWCRAGKQVDVDDSELSAPAAAVYVSHSSDFVDVLNDCWTGPNLYWT